MKSQRKFTLIELLMVMAVIAVLAGLVMPAISFVQKTAMRTKTKSLVSALYLAIKQYESTYGTLPQTASESVVSDYAGLILTLTANGNTRGISFLAPNSGTATAPGLTDMWTHNLKVIMSSNPAISGSSSVTDTVFSNVAVWSMGANGVDDKGSSTKPADDIASWK